MALMLKLFPAGRQQRWHTRAPSWILRNMATATNVQLSTALQPAYYRPGITTESTELASKLLQENHERHHIFFNNDGFHNHIAHHLLTIWSLRAAPEDIQRAYDNNKSYQRPQTTPKPAAVDQLHDPERFSKYLGPGSHSSAFLRFFEDEINRTSWQDVLQKYVFAGDARADDMFVRLFAGLVHPLIHLGFGVDFHQPAIIAEALTHTACHSNGIAKLLVPAEKAARGSQQSTSIVQLLDEIRADETLRHAPKWSHVNRILDSIIKHEDVAKRMISYLARVHVDPSQLQEKTAEMTNAVAYYTSGAQREDKAIKHDFYFIHCLNASIFYSAFLKQDWLSDTNKARLVEHKIRLDLIMYASRALPEIRLQDIREYKPEKPSGWDGIADRVCLVPDDGHASKLVRALAHGQAICEPYAANDDAFRIKHDDWLQMGHMAIDSVEAPGPQWVRSAGFEEAWAEVPAREKSQL